MFLKTLILFNSVKMKNILFLSVRDITTYGEIGRPHYFIKELSSKYKVIIFNNPQIWKRKWAKASQEYLTFFNRVEIIDGYPIKLKSPIINYFINLIPNIILLNILIRKKKIDTVISYSEFFLLFFSFFWKPRKIKVIFDLADYLPNFFRYQYSNILTKNGTSIIKALMDNSIKKSNFVTTSSYLLGQYSMNITGKNKVTVITNGFYGSPKITNLDLRSKLGFQKEDIILGYMGTLQKNVQLEEIIKILPKIRKKNSSIKMLIIGGGIKYNYLNELVDELNLKEIVYFTGRVSRAEVSNYIACFDIGLIPLETKWAEYTRPNKLFDYLVNQKPVISTSFPELIYSFPSKKYPYIQYYRDETSLILVIENIVEDIKDNIIKNKMNEMQEEIYSKYNWQKLTTEFRNLIEKTTM